jgi:hypothetical protein
MIQDLVYELYVQHWGEPSRRAHFQSGDTQMEILKWNSTVTDEGVTLYATLGSCNYPTSNLNPDHRAEYVMGLLPERDDVAEMLAAVGLYTARNHDELDHGHTIPVEGSLWPGSKTDYLLITRPVAPLVPPLRHKSGAHVEFMQVTPIFQAERSYKVQFGVDTLLDKWMHSGTQFWNSERPSGS